MDAQGMEVPATEAAIVGEVVEQEPVEETQVETEVSEQVIEEETEGITPPPPKKKSAQERIDEITKARREAEREREYWKRVALEREEVTKKQPAEHAQDVQPQGPPRPVAVNYDTVEAYEDALLDWHDSRKRVVETVSRAQVEETEAIETFQTNAQKLREEYEDFDEVIDAPVFTPHMRKVLLTNENGPLVAYYLGQPANRETAKQIMKMSPERQLFELGRLESKILLAKNTKTLTKSPRPLEGVKKTGDGGPIDESKLSDDQWWAMEKKRTLEKLKSKHGG